MFLEDNYAINISFITITNPNGAFVDILDEFPQTLQNSLSSIEVDFELRDIFPTSISLSLEGYKYDILEAIGEVTQLLVSYNIHSFTFTSHIIEEIED
jgi:hypothetical protein